MFDDEKEFENWDNEDTEVNISSDEPSWDDILDNAVMYDDIEEETPQTISFEEDYPQQNEAPSGYEEGQVYDVIDDDEPIVETTSQSRETSNVSGLYANEQQEADYNNYQAETYEEPEVQNTFTQNQSASVASKPIGIKQDKKSSTTSAILGIVVAILFAYAGYMGYNYLKENDFLPDKTEQNEVLTNQSQNDEDLFDDLNSSQNEQNISQNTETQPEGEAKPNDKVVITVVNTGRANPFTPTGNFSEAGYTLPKGLDIMGPPSYDEDSTPNQIVDIVVSGILYDNYKPSAIITIGGIDHFVQRGDSIDEYVVSYIGPTTVTIRSGRNSYTASIGQQFNVKDRIQGETTYVKGKNGTTRQYFTPSENDIEE